MDNSRGDAVSQFCGVNTAPINTVSSRLTIEETEYHARRVRHYSEP